MLSERCSGTPRYPRSSMLGSCVARVARYAHWCGRSDGEEVPSRDIGGEEARNGVAQSVTIVVLTEWEEVAVAADVEEEEDAKLRNGGCISPH